MPSDTVSGADTDEWENRIGSGITARLNEAIPKGSAAEIARRAGVPYPSLRDYLSGSQPRPAVLVRLAQATGVRLEWLMTGTGPTRAGEGLLSVGSGLGESAPEPRNSLGLTWEANPDRLAKAYDMALNGIVVAPGHRPDSRRLMQVTLLIYDELTDAEESAKAAPNAP